MHLSAMADRTGCAIVGIMHLNKDGRQANSIYRISASVAFAAAARSVLGMALHPDDPERGVLVSIKHNVSAEAKPLIYHFAEDGVFAWEQGTVEVDAHTIFALPHDEGDTIQEAWSFLDAMLEKGPVKSDQLFKEAGELGISASTLKRAKAKYKNSGREIVADRVTFGNDGRGYWVWRYATDERREPQEGRNPHTIRLTPLRDNSPEKGPESHHEAIPVRGSSHHDVGDVPTSELRSVPIRGSAKESPPDPLTGPPMPSDEEGDDDF